MFNIAAVSAVEKKMSWWYVQ